MRGLGTSAREASEAHGIMAVVETWTCFDCDWDNDVSLSVCEMCDTARDLSCASDLSHSLSLALVVTCSGIGTVLVAARMPHNATTWLPVSFRA